MLKNLFSLTLYLVCISGFSQVITARIIDKTSKSPVSFAAIQTGKNKGVMSNEEGVFNLNFSDQEIKELTISCLGYETLTIAKETIITDNYIVSLKPAVNELNTIHLSNNRPHVDSIIARVISNFDRNYKTKYLRYDMFFRETSYMDFDNLEFEIKKASHVRKKNLVGVNKELTSLTQEVMSGNFMHFLDFTGNLNVIDNSSVKMEVKKATQVINSNKDFSLERLQQRAQNTILKYLDSTITYKLKTGLFKIEDSLSIADTNKQEHKEEFDLTSLKNKVSDRLSDTKLRDNSVLQNILNLDYYEYELSDITVQNNELIYIIGYKPKRSKAKYTGTLYVTSEDYAVLKTDYKYSKGKRGEKLNLRLIFGIKYIENVSKGIIIFKKNEEGSYEPRYAKEESGQYFYLNRPLKFIENTADRNKVSFNFKIEGDIRHKQELLFTSIAAMDIEAFNNITEVKVVPYQVQRKYDANVWENSETLVPSEELKAFDASKDN